MFLIVDDHGEVLGKYQNREDAMEAFETLTTEDMLAADECAVIEIDAQGKRVGEAVTTVYG